MKRKKESEFKIPVNYLKSKSKRCAAVGTTKPVTVYNRTHDGCISRDEEGKPITHQVDMPMNRKERRGNAHSYKTTKKIKRFEQAMNLMAAKNKIKKEAKEKKEVEAIKADTKAIKAKDAKKVVMTSGEVETDPNIVNTAGGLEL